MAYSNEQGSPLGFVVRNNCHFLLVILFFILNGYNQQHQAIPALTLLLLFFKLATSFGLLLLFLRLIFKSWRKAGILTSYCTLFVLFFGVIQDGMRSVRWLANHASMILIVSVAMAVLFSLAVFLYKSKKTFRRAVVFINVLFSIYLLVEVVALFSTTSSKEAAASRNRQVTNTIGEKSPDIYLIILDEYFGKEGVEQFFGANNNAFYNELDSLGFKVVKRSRSNYEATIFSIASMFSMDYLPERGRPTLENQYMYSKALDRISSNVVAEMLLNRGYEIQNLTLFDFNNQNPAYTAGLLPDKVVYINSKTLYFRINRRLPHFLANHFRIYGPADNYNEQLAEVNRMLPKKMLKIAEQNSSVPKFVYLHLLMPHTPLLYNRRGEPLLPHYKRSDLSDQQIDKEYLEYLYYTNSVMTPFLGELISKAGEDAVIILMSDHGYRRASWNGNPDYQFMTINAIKSPSKYKLDMYDGMSNVNQFRMLFNGIFSQNMPMLKDSLTLPSN